MSIKTGELLRLQRRNCRALSVGANMAVVSKHRTRDATGERPDRFFAHGRILGQARNEWMPEVAPSSLHIGDPEGAPPGALPFADWLAEIDVAESSIFA